MHIYFLAIGGAGIGPLAQIAYKSGYEVSGSDIQSTSYIDYLRKSGINDIEIGSSPELIISRHHQKTIDWLVYSTAVPMSESGKLQLEAAEVAGIKCTKRDQFIKDFVDIHNLKMIAIAGTHGKTTTTAMLSWLFLSFHQPISYLISAKVSFGDMASFNPKSQYFIYEADEYDRNFLAFNPYLSLISGISWDHHEIYPTKELYIEAFKDFISQSRRTIVWASDADYLAVSRSNVAIQDDNEPQLNRIKLIGQTNRRDGWLAAKAASQLLEIDLDKVIGALNLFPGLSRRMEEIYPNLYSDYAHTPDKIKGAMTVASEISAAKNKPLIVIYEPLTNRRQKYMINDYRDCFKGASHLYWLPSYLAREDPKDEIIEPSTLTSKLSDPSIAEPAERNDQLLETIQKHLASGHMVVGMAGGGGGSLDDWLRENFKTDH